MAGEAGDLTDAVQKSKRYFGFPNIEGTGAGGVQSGNPCPGNPVGTCDCAPWDLDPANVARPHMPHGEAEAQAELHAAQALATALRSR